MNPPRVDPRVAKRRQEVARAAGRRRLRLLLVLGGVVAVFAAVGGLLVSAVFDVDRVEVQGARHTSLAAVIGATELSERGHPMVSVDRFALARRVERLPWVDTASVTRRWPNVVRVRVVERRPLGVIGVPGGVALVDDSGRVLATATEAPPDTYAVAVAPGDTVPAPGQTVPAAVRGALRILTVMSDDLATKVEAARRLPGDPATYELGVRGGVTIRLGAAQRIPAKLAAAEAVLAAQHSPGTVIDVRVPRSPAVTRA
ncbi:MAG TPA: FtsQ-type POTRA domain-containing protein [Acidimicrobiales bacterium]|nr:FtsQ-type POTRA domain-containing protein [Acidimicrobiales bacterium]